MSFGGTAYQSASPQERAVADAALTEWQGVQKDFVPLMQQSATRAMNAGQRDNARQGGIAATVGQGIDSIRRNVNSGLFPSGTAPSSGKFLMSNNGNARTVGLSKALAKGVLNNESSYLSGMGKALQQGQSLLSGSNAARNSLAGYAAADNRRSASVHNDSAAAIGQGVGAAVGMFGSMGGFSDLKDNLSPGGKWNNSGGKTSGGGGQNQSLMAGTTNSRTSNADFMKMYGGQ